MTVVFTRASNLRDITVSPYSSMALDSNPPIVKSIYEVVVYTSHFTDDKLIPSEGRAHIALRFISRGQVPRSKTVVFG